MRRMSSAERRDQLLDAAREIVLEEGFYAVSMDSVARAAGVTRPLVYAQFGDLAGLTTALVERESATALTGLARVLADVDPRLSPAEQAVATTSAMLEVARSAPKTWRVLLEPPQGGPGVLYDTIARGRALARSAITERLTAVGVGLTDPELTAHLVHLAVDELVRLHLTDPDGHPEERVLDQVRLLVSSVDRAAQPARS